MNNEKESFLKRKNVIISFKRYGIDAMGSMALGLFASLLIGTIINTIGQNVCPGSFVSEKLLEIGGYATSVTGAKRRRVVPAASRSTCATPSRRWAAMWRAACVGISTCPFCGAGTAKRRSIWCW